MQTLSVLELQDRLAVRRGAQIVTMVARTNHNKELAGGKKSPLAGRVVEKVSNVNGMVNWKYENAVNNQRDREGAPVDADGDVEQFYSMPRTWGHRAHNEEDQVTPFVYHIPKDTDEKRVYVEFKHQNSLGHQWYLDGEAVPADQVEPFLRPKTESKRQQVENPIILRDYRLSSIEHITFGGETFALEVNADEESALFDKLQPRKPNF